MDKGLFLDPLFAHQYCIFIRVMPPGQQVVFQRGGRGINRCSVDKKFSKESIEVPDVIHRVIELNKPIVKEPTFHVTRSDVNELFDFTSETEGNLKFQRSKATDEWKDIQISDV